MSSSSSPLLVPMMMLLLAMARPCSSMDPIGAYYAKNGASAETQTSIDQVLVATSRTPPPATPRPPPVAPPWRYGALRSAASTSRCRTACSGWPQRCGHGLHAKPSQHRERHRHGLMYLAAFNRAQ
ncbi:hypothetical protein VPH35_138829 [Triticum aestivum]